MNPAAALPALAKLCCIQAANAPQITAPAM